MRQGSTSEIVEQNAVRRGPFEHELEVVQDVFPGLDHPSLLQSSEFPSQSAYIRSDTLRSLLDHEVHISAFATTGQVRIEWLDLEHEDMACHVVALGAGQVFLAD